MFLNGQEYLGQRNIKMYIFMEGPFEINAIIIAAYINKQIDS